MSVSSVLCAAIGKAARDLRARKGWRRNVAAFAFGFASALGFAPTGLFPVLWIGFPALIILLQGTPNARAAFVTGWSFAFGYFLLGLYWIAAAMFVDIDEFWWAVPLAVAGLPAVLAVYYGLAAALARRLGLDGVAGALTFALAWFAADCARGHFLTGFPWNLEGYVWFRLLPMLQIASVMGVYGLTLLTVVAACLPACLFGEGRGRGQAVIVSLLALTLIGGWGEARLSAGPGTPREPAVRVRVVQPNIDQAHKWLMGEREANFRKLLDLTSAPAKDPVAMVVWPETASTYYLTEELEPRLRIMRHMPQGTVAVITGVIRHDWAANGVRHYYNALVAVDASGSIAAVYDKAHLVPFGEYIPFRHILPLPTLASFNVDFSAGPGARTLHVPGLPSFSPFICYEAIFPGAVANDADRPQLLLNITNDGWYGRTAGPYQHFTIARLRAIEEGLPLVRAANTGISGVVDAFGRVTAVIGLDKTEFVDALLPPAAPPTLYERFGDVWSWAAAILVMASILLIRKGKRD